MNPTGTLHRDTRITKRDTATRERDAGGQWGRNLGTLPAGETDVTLGDAILGRIGTHFRDKTLSPSPSPSSPQIAHTSPCQNVTETSKIAAFVRERSSGGPLTGPSTGPLTDILALPKTKLPFLALV